MTLVWNDAIGFLRAGNFQQAAASLDRMRQECERQGDAVLTAAINTTQKLCLMCLDVSTATYHHQQAIAAMSDQLDKLSAELFAMVATLQDMELHPMIQSASAPTIPASAAAPT